MVSLSLSEISPRDSRIGLTMRQPALGRLEWIQEAHKKAEGAAKKAGGGGGAKKTASAKAAAKEPAAAS